MIINTSVSVNLWLAKGNIEWQKQLTQFTDTTNLLPDKECWMIIVAVTKHYLDMWITLFCTSIYPSHMNYILSGADVNQIHLLKTIQSNSHAYSCG